MIAAGVLAPAKVNLFLHVTGRRPDGYHLLDSLVVFADIGDRVEGSPADIPSLAVGGPEAAALADLGDDNLVLRAARLYIEAAERRRRGGAVSRQAPADGIGDRRRIERRGGDAAPARLPVGRHRQPRRCWRSWRRGSAPTCRPASRRGRSGSAASAKCWSPPMVCPRPASFWPTLGSRCPLLRCFAGAAGSFRGRGGLPRCRATPPRSPRYWRPAATI